MSSTSPVPAKRKRMTHADRREQLLDVAEGLFVTFGYAAVTMEDIARAAQVTRPVVYNHFETRECAYLAVVRRAREQYDQMILSEAQHPADPKERLRRGAEIFFGILEDNPGRWMLLFGSTAVLPTAYATELAELRFGTIRAIREVVGATASDADPWLLEAVAHAVSGVGERLGHWRLADPSVTIEELVTFYTDILWTGIGRYIDER